MIFINIYILFLIIYIFVYIIINIIHIILVLYYLYNIKENGLKNILQQYFFNFYIPAFLLSFQTQTDLFFEMLRNDTIPTNHSHSFSIVYVHVIATMVLRYELYEHGTLYIIEIFTRHVHVPCNRYVPRGFTTKHW